MKRLFDIIFSKALISFFLFFSLSCQPSKEEVSQKVFPAKDNKSQNGNSLELFNNNSVSGPDKTSLNLLFVYSDGYKSSSDATVDAISMVEFGNTAFLNNELDIELKIVGVFKIAIDKTTCKNRENEFIFPQTGVEFSCFMRKNIAVKNLKKNHQADIVVYLAKTDLIYSSHNNLAICGMASFTGKNHTSHKIELNLYNINQNTIIMRRNCHASLIHEVGHVLGLMHWYGKDDRYDTDQNLILPFARGYTNSENETKTIMVGNYKSYGGKALIFSDPHMRDPRSDREGFLGVSPTEGEGASDASTVLRMTAKMIAYGRVLRPQCPGGQTLHLSEEGFYCSSIKHNFANKFQDADNACPAGYFRNLKIPFLAGYCVYAGVGFYSPAGDNSRYPCRAPDFATSYIHQKVIHQGTENCPVYKVYRCEGDKKVSGDEKSCVEKETENYLGKLHGIENKVIRGWACIDKSDEKAKVNLYAVSNEGQLIILNENPIVANKLSGVGGRNNKCHRTEGTPERDHKRFEYSLTSEQQGAGLAGLTIIAKFVNPNNGLDGEELIKNNKFSYIIPALHTPIESIRPKLKAKDVLGDFSYNDGQFSGWACIDGDNTPLTVIRAVNNQVISKVLNNMSGESAIGRVCHGTAIKRFYEPSKRLPFQGASTDKSYIIVPEKFSNAGEKMEYFSWNNFSESISFNFSQTALPILKAQDVRGHFSFNGGVFSGWVCIYSQDTSLQVLGTKNAENIVDTMANAQGEGGIGAACNSSSNRRFSVNIDESIRSSNDIYRYYIVVPAGYANAGEKMQYHAFNNFSESF